MEGNGEFSVPSQEAQKDQSADKEIVAALKEAAKPLKTIDPEAEDRSDLEPFAQMVGDARLVGLGEATHGNAEFIQVRDRMTRYLVEEKGFDGVILECPSDDADKLDRYINDESTKVDDEATLREIMLSLDFWVYKNQEFETMVRWMKRHNLDPQHEKKLSIKGCDVPADDERRKTVEFLNERDRIMADNTVGFLNEDGGKKYTLWASNGHLGKLDVDIEIDGTAITRKLQGAHLKERLDNQYVNFATIFNEGSVLAVQYNPEKDELVGGLDTFRVPPLGEGSYESLFVQTNPPYSVTDLRTLRTKPIFLPWTTNRREDERKLGKRGIGAGYDPHPDRQKNDLESPPLADQFDGAIWIKDVTAPTMVTSLPQRSSS